MTYLAEAMWEAAMRRSLWSNIENGFDEFYCLFNCSYVKIFNFVTLLPPV